MALFDIKMPRPGESVTEGTIVALNVKVGDKIEEDDVLFEITTAKVSVPIPSPVDGVVKEVLYAEGDTVAVGEVVLRVSSGDDDADDQSADHSPEEKKAEKSGDESEPKDKKASSKNLSKSSGERWYSPVVLQKAKSAKISPEELDQIEGHGFEGRVTKHDITLYIEQKKGAPKPSPKAQKPATATAPTGGVGLPSSGPIKLTPSVAAATMEGDNVIEMDPIRKVIADRMLESKQIAPHVTNVIEVDVSNLVRWRNENKEEFKKREGVSLTYMAPLVEAVSKALKDYPRINSSVDGYNIIEHKAINVGLAVAQPNGNLVVPVIKNADKQNIAGLANSVASLATKARDNKLTMDEMQGGTFTISNFGSFKGLFGSPIINQPEVAILGVGVIEKKPAIVETPEGPSIAIRHKMYLSLSFDHRVIDGMLGGNFLAKIGQYLEEWDA